MLTKDLSLRMVFLRILKDSLAISLFISFLSLSSKVKLYLPYSPVPITLQTLVVFLGVAFLREKAVISQIIWIILALLGLPLFSQGGGFLYLFSPTWGYILGFLVSSLFLLKVLFLRRSVCWYMLCFFSANIIIYVFGIVGLISTLRISFSEAFIMGILPFVYGDFLKIILASLVSRLVRLRKLE